MATSCTASGNISTGDAVCVVAFDSGNSRPTVARASRANLASSKTVFGVARETKTNGQPISVNVAGEVTEESISSLGAGDSRIIATDINQAVAADQCRLVRVDRPDGSEHIVGTCDASGNLAVVPRASQDTSSQHVFNIKSYGGLADGRLANDAAIVVTDITLTTVANFFVASDVGKSVLVAGAGTDGSDLVAEIVTFNSATSVDLDTAAGTTVSDALAIVWQADRNVDALVAALAAMPSSGGVLSFPASDGEYVFDDDVALPPNVQLQLDDGARLWPITNTTFRVEGRVRCHLFQFAFSGRGSFELGDGLERYSPQNFGADPTGVASCDVAFTRMFVAMRASRLDAATRDTDLAIVELGPGTYRFLDNLVIPGNCVFTGPINLQAGETGAVTLDFASTPGKGVIIPNGADPRFGRATSTTFRNVFVSCATLEPPLWEYARDPEPREYEVGEIVFLPHSHEFVYECIKGGTTLSAPYPEWVSATPYFATDRVVAPWPNFDGHVYEALNDGTSTGVDPFAPMDRTWVSGRETPDNDIVWKEVGHWTTLVNANPPPWAPPEDAICIGDSVRRGAPFNDWNPRYVWTPSTEYPLNAVILAPDGMGGVRTDAAWALLEGGGQTQGGTSDAVPPADWDPLLSPIADGPLLWTAIDPAFYIWENGDSRWVARAHPGVYAESSCTIENILVAGPTTAKVQLRARTLPTTNINFWRVRDLHLQGGTGPGLVVSGSNCNGGLAQAVIITGANTESVYREWDYGIRDGSLLSCAWVGCGAEGVTGYGFTANNANGQSAFLGCYLEGESAGTRMADGVICGGSLAGSPELTEDSFPIVIASRQSQNVLCASLNYADPEDGTKAIRVTLCSVEKTQTGMVPFSIYAGAEFHGNGFGWSTEMNARGVQAPLGGGPGRDGWWLFAHWPESLGTTHSAYAISGSTAEALRDFPEEPTPSVGGAAGMFWVTQNHLFFGSGADAPVCIKSAGALPDAGDDWAPGDLVLNRTPDDVDQGFAGWACRKAGGQGTWVPFGILGYELALDDDFTTTDNAATATPLTFPVRAGDVWSIEYLRTAECSTADGVAYAIDFPAVGSWIEGWVDSTAATLADRSLQRIMTSGLTATPIHTAVAEAAPDRIVATVGIGEDGDLTIMAASVTNGDLTTIRKGASLRARRLSRVSPPPP